MIGVALVGAVPVGNAAGRWLWTAFAQDLGILVRPVVPLAPPGQTRAWCWASADLSVPSGSASWAQ